MQTKAPAYLLSVFGKDQPGIISAVTGILFQKGGNLEDISMTILAGEFAMMLLVSFRKTASPKIARELGQWMKSRRLIYFWKPVKAADLIHGDRQPANTTRYLISAAGRDRTGIVHQVSRFMAQKKLNITDLNSKLIGRGKTAVYAMLLEADVPRRMKVSQLETGLGKLGRKLKLEIRIRPVEHLNL